MATQMYSRYGGTCQTQPPLTDAEKEYDNTCRAIDYAQREIAKKSMALFTAAEFMWFSHYINKLWFFPTQEKLDHDLVAMGDLLKRLEAREHAKTTQQRTDVNHG